MFFLDCEIVICLFGEEVWLVFDELCVECCMGCLVWMLYEVFGDIWVVCCNLYLQDDLFDNLKCCVLLIEVLNYCLIEIGKCCSVDFIEYCDDVGCECVLCVEMFEIVVQCVVNEFVDEFDKMVELCCCVIKVFGCCMQKDNICFDGLLCVLYVIDVIDWCVEYLFVVLMFDIEVEIVGLIKVCFEFGLIVILCGGGIGYMGGVVLFMLFFVVINIEKFE